MKAIKVYKMTLKKMLLMGAATGTLTSVFVGVLAAVFAYDPETITRAAAVCNILVLGSVGLFFIGLAAPKEQENASNLTELASNNKRKSL